MPSRIKKLRNIADNCFIGTWIAIWVIIVITALASCCQPKVIEKRADGLYRMQYKGTTYVTDNKYTKP